MKQMAESDPGEPGLPNDGSMGSVKEQMVDG